MTGKRSSIEWSITRKDSVVLSPAYDIEIGLTTFRIGRIVGTVHHWATYGSPGNVIYGSLSDALETIKDYIVKDNDVNTVQD